VIALKVPARNGAMRKAWQEMCADPACPTDVVSVCVGGKRRGRVPLCVHHKGKAVAFSRKVCDSGHDM